MPNLDAYWPEILDVVRQKVHQQTFNTWFLPLYPENTENGDLKVACPNHFFMDWFSEHHLTSLNEAGSSYFGRNVNFTLQVDEEAAHQPQNPLLDEEKKEAKAAAGSLARRNPNDRNSSHRNSTDPAHNNNAGQTYNGGQTNNPIPASGILYTEIQPTQVSANGPIHRPNSSNLNSTSNHNSAIHPNSASHLNPDYSFQNFVVGSGTDLAFAAATAIANNPGSHFNPLFVHGGTGLGKTHLMQSIGNEIARQRPEMKIVYVTAERFMNDLIGSIRDNKTPEFKLKYRSVDVLLVDDVAFLAGKESTQEEFFHTFNALYDAKKQIVLTSDRSPKEIATLEERLRSRFEWGLITDIQAPNLETRIAILKRKIEVNRIYITDEVVTYIAENITDNIRRLEGALIRLLAFASLTGREITLDMASEVLSSFFQSGSSGPVKIADVMKMVSETQDVSIDELKSKRRTQDLARTRQIAMYLSREMTTASLNQIGRAFGKRDHSTVSYACQKIKEDMESDPRFRGQVRDIIDRIRGKN